MTNYQFELRPFFGKRQHGRKGVVGDFGEVTVEVERKSPSVKAGSRQTEVHVYGEKMPEVRYQTVGPGRPTLRNARLAVDGNSVHLDFNAKGLTNTARALRIAYQDRTYEYVAESPGGGGTLTRPGVTITVTRRKNTVGKGMSSLGSVTGAADAVDLALAVLFEEVDTVELTISGAVSGALGRLLNPRSNEPVAE
ncbi:MULTISPECIES: hypothetical protein [unclassified Streptomyces]|uniref:hypothetical protein n=1 Tax=unclassified Streptomyces TaxID=2593676 RepID=UPI0037F42685